MKSAGRILALAVLSAGVSNVLAQVPGMPPATGGALPPGVYPGTTATTPGAVNPASGLLPGQPPYGSVAGTALTSPAQSNAAAPAGLSNAEVAQQWFQATAGASPSVVAEDDGSSKLEWHGGLSFDNYTNSVRSGNTFGSALKPGAYSLLRLQSDLRAMNAENDVTYFQFALSATDDRTVLSQYPRHIDMFQIGRAGVGYQVALGDVAPNFSSLSSAMGMKGLLAQRLAGSAAISFYAGVMAPSWEQLEHLVQPTLLSKTVSGGKVEYAFSNSFRAYVTGQHGEDIGAFTGPIRLAPARTNTTSVGFNYAHDELQLSGETAYSEYSQEGEAGRRGGATIIDGSWRGETYTLRAGYHNLDANFSSLSYAARAGTREAYTGGDWSPATWISLGGDVRNSRNYALPSFFVPARMSDTDSSSVRANLNLGADYPNWNIGLQSSASTSKDTLGNGTSNEFHSANLNYAGMPWTASLGVSTGEMSYSAFREMSGRMDSWMASVGRSFSDQDGFVPASWMVNASLSGNYQNQHLNSGNETKSVFTTLNLSGQRSSWGMLNVALGTGFNTRPLGQSALRMSTVQVDGSRPIGAQGQIKLYARDVRRNVDDAALFAEERVTGVQLSYRF